MSKSEMLDQIVSLLGGRTAEKLMLDDISTGASNDLERVSEIARRMITRYGMSDRLGPITFGSAHDEVFLGRDFTSTRTYSETIATAIDDEVKRIVDEAYRRCEEILKAQVDKLTGIAEFLLEHETMDAEQFEEYYSTGKVSVSGDKPSPKTLFEEALEWKDRYSDNTDIGNRKTDV
jgi:cell division protease FtsH